MVGGDDAHGMLGENRKNCIIFLDKKLIDNSKESKSK